MKVFSEALRHVCDSRALETSRIGGPWRENKLTHEDKVFN